MAFHAHKFHRTFNEVLAREAQAAQDTGEFSVDALLDLVDLPVATGLRSTHDDEHLAAKHQLGEIAKLLAADDPDGYNGFAACEAMEALYNSINGHD